MVTQTTGVSIWEETKSGHEYQEVPQRPSWRLTITHIICSTQSYLVSTWYECVQHIYNVKGTSQMFIYFGVRG